MQRLKKEVLIFMSEENQSAPSKPVIQYFNDEECQQIIASFVEFHGYSTYWQEFSKVSRNANAAGETDKGIIYELLSAVSSYMIEPDSINEPFKAIAVFGNNRSPIPDDLTSEDIQTLKNILPQVSDKLLTARIADTLWLRCRPREKEHALIAIEAYLEIDIFDEQLLGDSRNAWLRAITLCKMLKTAASSHYDKICSLLLEKIKGLDYSKKWDVFDICEIALKCHYSESDYRDIVHVLENIYQQANKSMDWQCIQRYSDLLVELYRRLKDEESECRVYKNHAESYASMAEVKTNANILRGSWLESAIKIYRQIPKKFRDQFEVDKRLAELHSEMNTANEKATDEMSEISSPSIDISHIVENAQNHVSGKSFPAVLQYLAFVSNLRSRQKSEDMAKEILGKHCLSKLFGSTHLSSDGRVVSRTPGIDLMDSESASSKAAIWDQMLTDYNIGLGLTVQGSIIPALDIVNLEHHITLDHLVSICRRSNTVPTGREYLWAKGLYHGFERDFCSSTHLLAPQLENLVRLMLKNKGIKTTTLDSNGIETENGLSTLLEKEGAKEAIGIDFHFELTVLMTDAKGYNLRNLIAHGLLSPNETFSDAAIYLWWFSLRLMISGI